MSRKDLHEKDSKKNPRFWLRNKDFLMGRGGLEPPTHGFSVRCTNRKKRPDGVKKPIKSDSQKELTPKWTPESQGQSGNNTINLSPDLAEIVAAWPELPEHIKAAIKALVGNHNSKTSKE